MQFLDTSRRYGRFNHQKYCNSSLENPHYRTLWKMKYKIVPESCVNCVAGCVMLSHTTAQHVCADHSLPVGHDTTNTFQYATFQRSTEITLKCCAEMLHESGRLSHNYGQNINVPLNIINCTQNYSPITGFQLGQG